VGGLGKRSMVRGTLDGIENKREMRGKRPVKIIFTRATGVFLKKLKIELHLKGSKPWVFLRLTWKVVKKEGEEKKRNAGWKPPYLVARMGKRKSGKQWIS